MQFSWILFAIFGLTLASPVDIKKGVLSEDAITRNSILENLILDTLEDLREAMLAGSTDMPVLDPLEIDHIHMDEQILTVPGAHVTVNDLKVSKLSTFVVDSLDVNTVNILLQRYRVNFDFYIPVVEVDAAYYDLLAAVAGVRIFGTGDAKIKIIEPRVTGSLLLGPRFSIGSGFYLTIMSSEVHFTLKEFEPKINGLLDDESIADFLNTFLKHFVPELVELYEPEISEFLSVTVQDIGNEFLSDLNLAGILG